MGNTVDFLPYMVETVGAKKNGKTWRNKVDTKTVKIATSEIHFSILKKKFYHTVEDLLHNVLRGITYQKIIFYGRTPLNILLL